MIAWYWLIPVASVSGCLGFLIAAILAAGGRDADVD